MNSEATLFLRVGLACNSRCYMCAGTWMNQVNLTTDQILSKLQRGRKEGLREVIFSGGEPTVRRDIISLVQSARDLGYRSIILQTNARRLAQADLTEQLYAAGVTRYVVSLHGHTSKINDSITRVSGSFEQTIKGIHNIQKTSNGEARIVVHCVILPDNFKYLRSLVRLLIAMKIPMAKLSYVVPIGRASGIHSHRTALPMSETLPYLFPALDEFLSYCQGRSRATVSTGYYPFCLLRGYERYSDDLGAPPNYLVTDNGDFLPATIDIENQNLKIKGPLCYQCTFAELCSGVWREYPEAHGWKEFVPITDYSPVDILPELVRDQE